MNTELPESLRRLYEKLYGDLGSLIPLLEDKNVNEISLNPDGKLFTEGQSLGKQHVGFLESSRASAIIHTIAGMNQCVITAQTPQLEAELPHFKSLRGERFTASIPPVVSAPCFNIRKRAEKIYTLDDYLHSERITNTQVHVIHKLLANRANILICGGPNSGKTTFTNALIVEAVRHHPHHRFLILEDTPELQCIAQNKVSLLTTVDISMTRLLKSAMRMSPDRILIGEVRGEEALTLLKAWNTGCPGGICTVHANGAEESLQRLADLALEAGLTHPPLKLILHTINAIVSLTCQESQKGFVEHIVSLKGYQHEKFIIEKLA